MILKIKEQYGENIIFDIEETDKEAFFKFLSKDIKKLQPYLLPLESGCNISPFSTKNLQKSKYIIPCEDLNRYKNLISILPKNDVLKLNIYTNLFIKTLASKKSSINDIKADIRKKGLKNKEYIHSVGYWDNYLSYLQKNIISEVI